MDDYQVRIGDILFLRCGHCIPPKNKYFVVVSIEPSPILLFVNSKLNDYVKNNPSLYPYHTSIKQSEHTFLKYDSWVNCCDPCIEFNLDNIEQDMKYGGKLCGVLSNIATNSIFEGVKNNPLLKRKIKARILKSLEELLN